MRSSTCRTGGPARFVGASKPEQQGLLPLEPNLAMHYGLYDARGYDFPLERRYSRLWEEHVSAEEGSFRPPGSRPIDATARCVRSRCSAWRT